MVSNIIITIVIVAILVTIFIIFEKTRKVEEMGREKMLAFFNVAKASFGDKRVKLIGRCSVVIDYLGKTFFVGYDPYTKWFHLHYDNKNNETFSTKDGNRVISFIEEEVSF